MANDRNTDSGTDSNEQQRKAGQQSHKGDSTSR
jgi:hypothetical protein